jgi:transcriptional regulator with XRE-family HTH domain
MNEGRKEFGSYIKGIRNKRGLSQHKLSALLGYKSNGTLNALEQGFAPLPLEKIHPLIAVLGISLGDLLARLRDCEPELYDRYMLIKKQFTDEIMDNLRTNLLGGEK